MSWEDEVFEKLGEAEEFDGGEFFRDGLYEVTLLSMKLEKGDEGTAFKNEFLIDKSTAVEELSKDGHPVRPNPVGSEAADINNISKFRWTYSNQKKLVLACLGMTSEDMDQKQEAENTRAAKAGETPINKWKSLMRKVCGSEQILRGVKLRVSTYRQATKAMKASDAPRREWHTYTKYSHIDQSAEEVKANRRRLDSSATVAAEVETVSGSSRDFSTLDLPF